MSSDVQVSVANVISTVSPNMDSACDWRLTKEKLTQRGNHILETEQWTDCTFIVGEETVKAHKLILAMSSPVFEAMFFGEMAEKNDPIRIADARPEVFKTLLQYIYTDNVKLEFSEIAYELCYCAKKYMFPFLVEECMKFIVSDLSPGKACRIYEFTKLFEKPLLLEKCLQMIRMKTNIVLSEPSFEEIELESLLMILEQTELRINSELEIFLAVERWARFKCLKNGLDPEDGESLRSVIGNAMTKIRFLTLTPREFAQGPAESLLLRENEMLHILKNISSKEKHLPMPEGFSTNTQSRGKRLKQEYTTSIFSTVVVMPSNSATSETIEPGKCLNESQAPHDIPMKNDLLNMMLFNKNGRAKEGWEHYCHRFTLGSINSVGSHALTCSETFVVNTSICVTGIQVPSQIGNDDSLYTEMLTVELLDCQGKILTKMDFAPEVNMGSLVKLAFDMPVYIRPNEEYRVRVAFGKVGCYPLLGCRRKLFCDVVFFTYGSTNSTENDWSDLITSIIYIPFVPRSLILGETNRPAPFFIR